MGIGLGLLRLPPGAFWAMTPLELAAVFGVLAPADEGAPARTALEALMHRFPDKPHVEKNHDR